MNEQECTSKEYRQNEEMRVNNEAILASRETEPDFVVVFQVEGDWQKLPTKPAGLPA